VQRVVSALWALGEGRFLVSSGVGGGGEPSGLTRGLWTEWGSNIDEQNKILHGLARICAVSSIATPLCRLGVTLG